jgi:hypothetical protein
MVRRLGSRSESVGIDYNGKGWRHYAGPIRRPGPGTADREYREIDLDSLFMRAVLGRL